jgi:hypothetical protein
MRLSALFLGTLLATALVATAALAAIYVQRRQSASPAPPNIAPAQPRPDLNLPPGLVTLQRVGDAAEFETLAGFAPFLPSALPETTATDAALSVTLPDANGRRYGRVAYSPKATEVEGISGPMVVLMEARGTGGPGVDGVLKRLGGGDSRAVAATYACGQLVIDAQFYYGPPAADGEPYITPYMTDIAGRFLDQAKSECPASSTAP